MGDDRTFSLEQAMTAQRKLRDLLGLGEERFPIAALVGMISDEIEQLRQAGYDDHRIATVITRSTGIAVDASDIHHHYASADERRRDP